MDYSTVNAKKKKEKNQTTMTYFINVNLCFQWHVKKRLFFTATAFIINDNYTIIIFMSLQILFQIYLFLKLLYDVPYIIYV